MKVIPIKQRLDEYKKCLNVLKSIKVGSYSEIGICVILGDIHSRSYFDCPWDDWGQLIEYYPELKEIASPITERACYTSYSVKKKSLLERIKIIESAIFKIK